MKKKSRMQIEHLKMKGMRSGIKKENLSVGRKGQGIS